MFMTFSCCSTMFQLHQQLHNNVRSINRYFMSIDSIQRPPVSYMGAKEKGGAQKNQNFHRTNLVLLYNVMHA